MALRTIYLPQDDPHVLAFLAGGGDRVSLLSKRLVESFVSSAVKVAYRVYDELERLAEEYGVDVRRLLWAFTRRGKDFLSLQPAYRISAAGAMSLFQLANAVAPGAVQEGKTEAYNEVVRTPVYDRNNPPFDGDQVQVREAMAEFARWARTFFKMQIDHLWDAKFKQTAKLARTALKAVHGLDVTPEMAERYILWDVQEALVRPGAYLRYSPRAKFHLAEILRWLADLQGPGRANPTRRRLPSIG